MEGGREGEGEREVRWREDRREARGKSGSFSERRTEHVKSLKGLFHLGTTGRANDSLKLDNKTNPRLVF